jgi:hypothetical protein
MDVQPALKMFRFVARDDESHGIQGERVRFSRPLAVERHVVMANIELKRHGPQSQVSRLSLRAIPRR